jgi:hypothetical protein
LHRSVCDHLIQLGNVYTSLWQAIEWGMHGLQETFPHCKKTPANRQGQEVVGVIFELSLLGLMRLQRYLTPNTNM